MDELLRIIREAKKMIEEDRAKSESLLEEALHPTARHRGSGPNIGNKLIKVAGNGQCV